MSASRSGTTEQLSKSTLSITELQWRGDGFSDPGANGLWLELPPELRRIALRELAQGNGPWNILRNSDARMVLLAFRCPPITAPHPHAQIRVHRSFESGNYCYDGTFCTYEHLPSGCFLAFDDPEWQDEN